MPEEPATTPQNTVDASVDTPADTPVDTPAPTVAPAPAKKKSTKFNNPYIWGTGRRKASVARVRIRPGDGKFIVNKKELNEFFCIQKDRNAALSPLHVTETTKSLDVFVNVNGGGTSGQAGAVVLGLARALFKSNPDLLPVLREHNLLSRDARKVERKKYGQRGARRKFQFSKR